MTSLLPSHEGLLPYWLILISALAFMNTVQCYRRSKSHALRTYDGPASEAQVTDFGARMYGTWTLLSGVVRLYAAYRVGAREVYVLALWTFVVALGQVGIEWLGYGTVKWGRGLAPVLIVPSVSVGWMLVQWDFYVG